MKSPRLHSALLRASLCSVCISVSAFGIGIGSSSDTSTTTQSAEIPRPTGISGSSITIPGPLRSFQRMAGISQKISAEEVLPLLARNVAVEGYQGRKDKQGRPTEFLILLKRYVGQARELVTLAGPEGVIRVSDCEQARPLLTILGYRLRQACGQNTSLETADAERAFLTIDSGFPLAELEETIRGGKAFSCPFTASQVPLLFSAEDWTQSEKRGKGNDVITEAVGALLQLWLWLFCLCHDELLECFGKLDDI